MNKPLPTAAAAETRKALSPRAEAVLELEEEIIGLFTGSERALLMAEDLVEEYFAPLSEEVNQQDRAVLILNHFEENRIRAQILHDILIKMHVTAKALDAELSRDAKEA